MSINSTNTRSYSTDIEDTPGYLSNMAVLNVEPEVCVVTGETVFIQPHHKAVFVEMEVLDSDLNRQLWVKWDSTGELGPVTFDKVVEVIKEDGAQWKKDTGR